MLVPYNGEIDEERCKGVIYNHGLYTQCRERNEGLCKKCINLKYGSIYDRAKYKVGSYITPSGKKEVDYNVIIKRMKYNKNEVKKELEKMNIEINVNNNKEEKDEKIEVIKYNHEGINYYITKEGIILNNNYDIIGIKRENNEIDIFIENI